MNKLGEGGFWANFGKASAVIGLLIGLLTLYRQMWPDEPQVRAVCRFSKVDMAFRIVQSSADLTDERRKRLVERVANSNTPLRDIKDGKVRSEVAEVITSDVLSELDFSRLLNPLLRVGTMLSCDIRNSGSKPALGTVLSVASAIKEALVGERVVEEARGTNLVKVGDLQPDAEISVVAFFDFHSLEEGVRVSHSTGRGKVEFPVEVFGVTAWLVRYWVPMGMLVVALLAVVLSILTTEHRSSAPPASPSSTPPSPPASTT